MKKRKDLFERYLDEIYDISKMLNEEGYNAAKRRYLEVVAMILLFILDSLRAIRSILCLSIGAFLFLLFKIALKF